MNPMLAMQGMNGINGMNPYALHGMTGMAGYYGQSQEEYDQFAAQLLFSLSAYQNGNAQMYDPNVLAQMQNVPGSGLQMDWTQNVGGVNGGQPVVDQNGNIIVNQQVVDQNGNGVNTVNALKGEQVATGNATALNQQLQQQQQLQGQQQVQQQQIMQMVGMNPQMQQFMELKPEQVYDPNFGYFTGVQMQAAYPQLQQLQGPLDVNHLNVDPTAKAINSKDSTNSKVSNTLSAATPREIVPENADQQNQGESDGKQSENDNMN